MSDVKSTCAHLHALARAARRYDHTFSKDGLPTDGIYLVFEEGERAHAGDRIVRVGSHTGHGTLPSRLSEHFVKENKDRSIFRKNIGRAMLAKAKDDYLDCWEIDMTSRARRVDPPAGFDADHQSTIEAAVTEYLRSHFSFVIIPMAELSERRVFEKKIGSLLFACPECRPSGDWLGSHSPKEMIQDSGLWQVNGLRDLPLTLGEAEQLWT
jgi:hypothetical protein